MSKKGRERREQKGNVKGGATSRGAMEKCGYVGVIEGGRSEEMTQSNTSSHGSRKYLLSPREGSGN